MTELRAALDRTLLLMRDDIRPETPDDVLLAALTDTEIALTADAQTLISPAAQTAFVTTALLCARSGHKVHLLAPDVALAAPQPPLQGTSMVAALLDIDGWIMPTRRFTGGVPTHAVDLEIRFGAAASQCQAHMHCAISATRWSARIIRGGNVGPWTASLVWPLGAMAGAVLAATEAFKCAMGKLTMFARNPEFFTEFFRPLADTTLALAPEATAMTSTLGMLDFISGGAITNGTLYALSRLPWVSGSARIVEPDVAEISNLNRYMLLLMDDLGFGKAERLAAQDLSGLTLKSLPWRFDNARSVGVLAPRVLVGVDHIPTRWDVQRANPRWLGIGATTHWSAMASQHDRTTACAGCAHPRDDVAVGPIPTVAVVSFLASLLQATELLRNLAGDRNDTNLVYVTVPRAEKVWRSPVAQHPGCPVGHETRIGG